MWRPFFLGAGHFLKAIAPEHAGPIKKADHKEREQTLWCATASQNSDAAGTAEYIRILLLSDLARLLTWRNESESGGIRHAIRRFSYARIHGMVLRRRDIPKSRLCMGGSDLREHAELLRGTA